MKIGGRLQGAMEVLQQIKQHNLPASQALKEWGRKHRFAGSSDRAAIGNIVYDSLRRQSELSWLIQSDKIEDIAYASLIKNEEYSLDELENLCSIDRFCSYHLDSEKRLSLERNQKKEMNNETASNMPLWIYEKLKSFFKDEAIYEAQALSSRPPLDLRVNFLKSFPYKVLKSLKNIKSLAQISWFDQALRISPYKNIRQHPNVEVEASFQKGWFEIQDLGSQLVAYLSFITASEQFLFTENNFQKKSIQVLDYCAGGGGKTLAIASLMKNKGQIYAYDKYKDRIAPIFHRLKRAGVRNSQIFTSIEDFNHLKGKMDLVLCDVPCTGSGTWRRHPDLKWKLKESHIIARTQEQKDILQKAAVYVKKGKYLAYMTCSIFPEENDEQIKNFLEDQPEFSVISLPFIWEKSFSEKNCKKSFTTSHGILLTPFRTKTDGFYLSILQKTE